MYFSFVLPLDARGLAMSTSNELMNTWKKGCTFLQLVHGWTLYAFNILQTFFANSVQFFFIPGQNYSWLTICAPDLPPKWFPQSPLCNLCITSRTFFVSIHFSMGPRGITWNNSRPNSWYLFDCSCIALASIISLGNSLFLRYLMNESFHDAPMWISLTFDGSVMLDYALLPM